MIAVMTALTPVLSTLVNEAYPDDAARQHALQLCGHADPAFNRLLDMAPQREDVWARVLELHLAAGDEHRALAALHQCEESLQAARIEPSGLLKELRRRIRREEPTEEDVAP